MEAFDQRKQREFNRKYNKQIADIKKQQTRSSKSIVDGESRRSDGGNSEGGKSKRRQGLDKKYSFGAKERMRSKLNDHKYVIYCDCLCNLIILLFQIIE